MIIFYIVAFALALTLFSAWPRLSLLAAFSLLLFLVIGIARS